ncbi:hypothetical protein [Tenacibaculum soleae]|uniref:hypothetical protein n=1 Tax=Tenacibaculum soleae TaxID=447689 RepID=UPI003AB1F0E3
MFHIIAKTSIAVAVNKSCLIFCKEFFLLDKASDVIKYPSKICAILDNVPNKPSGSKGIPYPL